MASTALARPILFGGTGVIWQVFLELLAQSVGNSVISADDNDKFIS